MDAVSSLQASFWLMVVIQTIGSVDMPGRGPRKMPSPRAYGATIVTWGVLVLIADAGGDRAGRAAKVMGWVIVLAGMVLGPFGGVVSNLFTSVAGALAPNVPSNASVPYPNPIQPTG